MLRGEPRQFTVTEGLLLEETPATATTIEALQALGARLILDDFGTGYSSLRYLQRCDFAQGFHLSCPLTLADLEARLRAGARPDAASAWPDAASAWPDAVRAP